jgi:predicted outer membrane repeat protein
MKKIYIGITLIVVSILFSNNVKASSISVSGAITTNTTWLVDTVKVTGDITVQNGILLTINPGVIVQFQGYYNIAVQGAISAIGLSNKPIVFTIKDTTGFSVMTNNNGSWNGISFVNTSSSNATSVFNYCRIQFTKARGTTVEETSGAGMFIKNFSKIVLNNCFFENNKAAYYGGAVYIYNSTALIKNSHFKNNRSNQGGALYIKRASPVILNNLFDYNFTYILGGAICCSDTSNARVTGNVFHHNLGQLGGAIGFYNSVSEFINNTITENKAAYGGGINCISDTAASNIYSNPNFYNTLFYNNTATGTGKQVNFTSRRCDPNFYNCDVQGGIAEFGGPGSGVFYNGQFLNSINSNPLFYDSITFNYQLKMLSPCVNAGKTDTTGMHLPSTDIMNNPRISGGIVDIGAYEHLITATACGNISQNTIWMADTIKVICDIKIDSGIVLTINPAVIVEFQGKYKIDVKGIIKAKGTVADSIFFIPKNISTGWNGIRYDSTKVANDTSTFEFCKFAYAKKDIPSLLLVEKCGGALYADNFSKLRIRNCRFSNNNADSSGTAIFSRNNTLKILGSIFTDNSTFNNRTVVHVDKCNFELKKNKFYNNQGTAVSVVKNSTARFTNNIFAGNLGINGGGMYIHKSTLSSYNNIFVNNSAINGGAIYSDTAVLKIINTTIANNAANGGGIYIKKSIGDYTNTILYGNMAGQIYLSDSISVSNFKFCDIEGDSTAFIKNTDAKFFGAFLNNLDTIPVFVNPTSGIGAPNFSQSANWSLDDCSFLYNKGIIDTIGLHLPPKDYAGNNRVYGGRVDIGAFELIKPHITDQPVTAYVCAGGSVYYYVGVASSVDITYQWQISTNGGSAWTNAVGPTANDSLYEVLNVIAGQNGHLYRCVINALCDSNILSSTAPLVVYTQPVISSEPVSVSVCQNSNTSFTVVATGSTLNYLWQYQLPGGATWANSTLPTANQPTLAVNNVQPAMSGNKYRCIICGECLPCDTTAIAILTVKASPAIASQPINKSVCEGLDATFSIVANGYGIVYLWEESTDNGASWHNAPGTNNINNYTLTAVTYSMNGNKYRCQVSGDCSPNATSNVVTLTVAGKTIINSQPNDTSVCVNTIAKFKVIASGGNLTFKWQEKAPASTWVDASGATSVASVYTINSAGIALNGYKYRCLITNICSPDTLTDSVLLTINPLPVVYLGHDTTLLQSQTLTLDAGSGFANYHWSDNSSDQTLVLDGSTIIIGQHLYSVTVTDNNSCSNSDDIIVTVVDDSGIEFFGGKARLSVYPNPSNGIINIDLFGNGIFNLEIYNPLGNKIIEKELVVSETGIKDVIDLSGNSKGIYIIKFEYLNEVIYRKIIIQ